MAKATWSKVMIREIKGCIEELQNIGVQRHEEMMGEMVQLQELIAHISRQVVEALRPNVNNQRGNYQAPTRFTKMDLPKFMKEDVVGWLSKCESYFDLDKTPEENKVVMASLMLDEAGYLWYDGSKKSSTNPITWHTFSKGLQIKFNATLQRPLEELVQLKQKGNLNEYQEKFERIACMSNLTEEQKLDCYLGGLKEEHVWDVRLFNPRSVFEATRLAKIKEMRLKSFNKMGVMSYDPKKGPGAVVRSQPNQHEQKGILGKLRYRF